jgi:hypothetical protein
VRRVHEPVIAEQVAVGIALGALGAVAHLFLERLRERLSDSGRRALGWAAVSAAFAAVAAVLLVAAAIAPLTAVAYVVGVLGTRTLVFADANPQG